MAHFYKVASKLKLDYMYSGTGELLFNYSYPLIESLEIQLISYESYRSRKSLSEETLYPTCLERNELGCYVSIDLKELNSDAKHFLVFTDLNNQEKYYFPVNTRPKFHSNIMLENVLGEWLPYKYFQLNTETYPRSINGSPITVQVYSTGFDPADPPTGSRKPSQKELRPDIVFTIKSGELLSFEHTGLYFLQTDPSSLNGLSFRVEEQPYPRFNRLSDLGSSMIYLTTKSEQETLQSSELDKKTFDSVWLQMAGTETNAKAAIRNYFRSVNAANLMFTTYKEGWKTDMGMIYIAFGEPDAVYLTETGEEWIYEANDLHEKMEFHFSAFPTVFSPYHSILQRNKIYSRSWNHSIDRMRKGIHTYE